MSTLNRFIQPPEYIDIEKSQKAKFLHVTLFIMAGGCLLMGLQNIRWDTNLDVLLFAFSAISLICIVLNKRGFYNLIVIFMTILTISTITFSLIDGIGLRDAGLIAYPIFIIFSSFFFNKQAAFITTLLSIASIFIVYIMEIKGSFIPADFSREDQLIVIIVLLIATGSLLWILMDNWEKILSRLREAYDLTLFGWAKALEYRDRETVGHSQRVSELTVRLARSLSVPENELTHIRRGALLHDLGKMAIPDSILLKEGSLTEEEKEIVQKHPEQAKDMLENIPFLHSAVDIPLYHHERWDGSGYPEGLSCEDIPLSARIFAVVDVWDALLSDRPYRKKWGKDETKNYLREQSGIMFDPKVIEVFIELIENDLYDNVS